MPAKKITVPVTPDMAKALDDLCELNALQLPSLASMLLRDALAGRRSALLPKRIPGPGSKVGLQDGSHSAGSRKEETGAGGGWGSGPAPERVGDGLDRWRKVNDEQTRRYTDEGR